VTIIVLLYRSEVGFNVVNGVPTCTRTPKGTYAILFLSMILWGTALGSTFADWPTDSSGNTLDKRYDYGGVSDGIQTAIEYGPFLGLLVMDGFLM
jgi:hypothetical protein